MLNVNVKIDGAAIEKLKGRLKEYCVEVIQDINEQVVEATPVKTGFLRNSWYAQLNSEPAGPGGTGGVATLNVVAGDLKIGDVYYAVNGANYAVFVEYGTSKMRPRAFVRGVIDRADTIAAAAAERVAST
jgi:hypothetical protein